MLIQPVKCGGSSSVTFPEAVGSNADVLAKASSVISKRALPRFVYSFDL
jgi:hypothetical protein